MKLHDAFVVIALAACFASGRALAQEDVAVSTNGASLPEIKNVLDEGKVKRIQIFAFPWYVPEDPIGFTPEILRKQAPIRCDLELRDAVAHDLRKALDETVYKDTSNERPVYWGAEFLDDRGVSLFSIYLDHRYTNSSKVTGWIGGQLFEMDFPVLSWFESYFNEDHMPPFDCEVKAWLYQANRREQSD